MTAHVHMKPGQWVVAFPDEYFDDRKNLVENVEHLRRRGAGWDYDVERVLVVRLVTRVMPKTYEAGGRRRQYRDAVVAVADTESEADALRVRLLAIGDDADREIEREVAELARPIERRVRADALAKVHAALPHIFGRPA